MIIVISIVTITIWNLNNKLIPTEKSHNPSAQSAMEAIENALREYPNSSALELCNILEDVFLIIMTKKDINRILYSMLKNKQIEKLDGTPPRWRLSDSTATLKHTYVFIDLGSASSALNTVSDDMYNRDTIHIHAYAGRGYAGRGVQPGLADHINVEVIQTGLARETSTIMIASIIKILSENQAKHTDVVIVTRDKSLLSLKWIITEHYKLAQNCTITTDV